MNEFANKLDKMLSALSITNAAAARQSNIDPTLLRRYRTGDRFPRNKSVIDKIVNGLGLSENVRKEIEEAYDFAKSSTKKEKKRSSSSHSSKPTLTIIRCDQKLDLDDKVMHSITNQTEFINYLSYLNQTSNKVYILSNKDVQSKQNIQYYLPSIHNGEYLICAKGFSLNNQQNLVLPVKFDSANVKQMAYVYPEECELYYNSLYVFSNQSFIKYTQYDNECSGFFSQNSDMISYYKDIFEKYKEMSVMISITKE